MYRKLIPLMSIMLIISLILSACDISITINQGDDSSSENNSAPPPTQRPANTPKPTATKVVNPTNEPIPDMYAGYTGDSEIPFLLLHNSGEKIGVSRDHGIVWNSQYGESIVIFADSNNLPQQAVIGEDIVLYSNYTASTVDITIVYPDGRSDKFRTEYDSSLLNKITSAPPPAFHLLNYSIPSQLDMQQVNWDYVKTGLYILSAATCIGAAPAVINPLTLILLAKACDGFVLETVIRVGKAVNLDVAPLEKFSNNLDAVGCINFNDLLDCAIFFANQMQEEQQQANIKVNDLSSNPEPQSTKCVKSKYNKCP